MAQAAAHSFQLRRDSYKSAFLTYQEGERRLDVYLEMSGVPQYDWVAVTTNFHAWTSPAGVEITLAEHDTIRGRVNAWAREHHTRVGVAEPSRLQSQRSRWLATFAICVAVVGVSVLWVDRPVAEFVQRHFHRSPLERLASAGLGMLTGVLFTGCAILLAATAVALSGRKLAGWARIPVLCSWSAFGALAVALLLKYALGRSQVVPAYLSDHIYTWRPFSRANGFGAFPSATTAAAMAVAAPMWRIFPRRRKIVGIGVALVAGAILVTNAHWLSDIIAGAFLGAWMGAIAVPRLTFRFRYRRFI